MRFYFWNCCLFQE